jgi:hypothetical protein
MTQVKMINSVDEYVAGETYDLDEALADVFVLKGYASAARLSREYTDEEIAELRGDDQTVNV